MTHYRADIEGLRAIAILLVIAYHAGIPGATGGYVGVDVFFVLSGYLITGLLVGELNDTGRIALANFYARRVRRLLPAMAVVVIATMIAGVILYAPVEHDGLANTAIATAAYVSNVYFARAATDYLAAPSHINPLLHTWSLSVEEQFYVMWPLLVMLVGLKWRSSWRRRLPAWMAAVAVASFGISLYLTRTNQPWAFFLPFARAWEFAAGGLVSFVHLNATGCARGSRRWATTLLGWGGLAGIFAAGIGFGDTTSFPGVAAMLPVAGTAAMLVAGTSEQRTALSRVLSWRWNQAVGRVSYSWYLWHWPLLVFGGALDGSLSAAGRVIAVLIALALAAASYRWVEQPIRTNPRLAKRPRRSLAAAAMVALVLLSACLGWKQMSARWEQLPTQATFSRMKNDFPAIYRQGCDLYYRSAEVKECDYGDPLEPRRVVLLGDSHAGHWFPAVEALYAQGDWRLTVITKSACPIVDATYFFVDIGRRYTECQEWVGRALARIHELKPDLVIVSYADYYQFPAGEWQAGIRRATDTLGRLTSPVVILRDVPHLPVDGPTCLARMEWRPAFLPRTEACSAASVPASEATTYQLQVSAAAPYRNITVVDMDDAVCPNGTCDALRDGVVTYRDTGHLTTEFARRLAGPLGERIESARASLVRVTGD